MSTIKFYHREPAYSSIDEIKESMIIEPFDEFIIPLKNGEIATAVFGGYVKGGRRRFVLKDCIGEPHVMNKQPTNKGGYMNSELRRYVLDELLPLFPDALRSAFIPRTMSEFIDGKAREYTDTLWIPSAADVLGDAAGDYWEADPSGEQLRIFERERDRVKEVAGKGTYPWWLRSAHRINSIGFAYVDASGGVSYGNAGNSLGVAPGFDL